MRIKKDKHKNEYLLTKQGMWVRNFANLLVPYIDINKTVKEKDYFGLLKNEYNNSRAKYTWIDTEKFYHNKVVIISDGYGFQEKHKLLEKLPADVALIGVHGALAKWALPRSLNYYVVNNPYQECMRYLPRRGKSLPKCIASNRTNYEFLQMYNGTKYRYVPVVEKEYSGMDTKETDYQVDDYRNPICASIALAYHFGVEKLLLLCCDDAFAEERTNAEQLHNGMWIYPPQQVAHGLIDGCLYWLKKAPQSDVMVVDHSSGPLFCNAEYITEDKLLSFFSLESK